MTPARSLSDNPAVANPMFTLTRGQRDALVSIDYFRRHRRGGGYWMFGDKRFAVATVTALMRHGLIALPTSLGPITLTTAGELALTRIRELGQ